MEGVDIYRLIGLCAIVVAAWVVQIIGFSTFKSESLNGPPRINVVDFDKDFSGDNRNRPLVEIGKEKGWDVNASFVSVSEAQKRNSYYERKKWLALLAGFGGMIVVFLTAYKLWGDWITGIACVLLGPLAVTWGIYRTSCYRSSCKTS